MMWKLCVVVLAAGFFGCGIIDDCGPFPPLNKKSFEDSITAQILFDSIKLEISVDYEYEKEIPVTIVRTTQLGDSLRFVGQFDGEYTGDSVAKINYVGFNEIEWRTDTLVLGFQYHSMSVEPTSDGPSKAKGSSQTPQCTPAGDRTELTSATLYLPTDLVVSIIWPPKIKIIE